MTKKTNQKPKSRRPKLPKLSKKYAAQIKDLMREGFLARDEAFLRKKIN